MAESSVPFPTGSGPSKVLVRSVERPTDAGWALIGGLDDPNPGRVDGGGAVAPADASWSLDWWIGAEDRWHFPSREPSVRQRRLGPGPVVETSVRVPGGDVTHTAYPVAAGRARAVAVEIRNDSKTPVTLALALRSLSLDGSGPHSNRLELTDPRTLAVDTEPAVLLPRPANQAAATVADDFPARLTEGEELSWDGPVAGSGAQAVLVYPLPHATSLRFTVLGDLEGDLDGLRPQNVPDPDAVRRGWATVLERVGSATFPDPGLTELTEAARARLVIEAPRLADAVADLAPGAGAVMAGLAAGGHGEECRTALLRLASGYPTTLGNGPAAAADVTAGVAAALPLLDEPTLTEQLLEPLMALTALIERSGSVIDTAVAQEALATVASLAGQQDAAAHIRAGIDANALANGLGARLNLDTVAALAQTASPAGRWADPTGDGSPDSAEAAARFWLAARRLLIDRPASPVGQTEATDTGELPVVELLPDFASAWMGGQLEVHRLPAAGAEVSFAIRWHGHRPALLWDVAGAKVRLTCPGLDPKWWSEEPTGEALLAGTAEELPEAPAPGDSFN